MKKEMRKIVTMLMLVCFFSVIAMAQIWIPWEMWNDHNRVDPCVHGILENVYVLLGMRGVIVK